MNSEQTITRSLVSEMADGLVGSEIIKLAGEIKQRIKQGETIYNFTIGDFDPSVFPIPDELLKNIIEAYESGHTNYPAANGIQELRDSLSQYTEKYQGLSYNQDEFLIAGGARPLIYALYQAVVNPGDSVLFPVPSWNNNHYAHLSRANQVAVSTSPENNFMPMAADLSEHINKAALVALCSPLNPTGTVFGREQLADICELIVSENERRGDGEKPVYLLYDQIYWQLTYGTCEHFDPVSLVPEIRPYTIYVDGISKAFAATGVRVGWSFGPSRVISKMKSILGHVGAWSPKAEQVATAKFLQNDSAVQSFMESMKTRAHDRLESIYQGIRQLNTEGLPVSAIPPQAAIYLTVQIDIQGMTAPSGEIIKSTQDATAYILNEASLGIVPFKAFGADAESNWYRISVGTVLMEDIPMMINKLRQALSVLS
jgi:aspartate aminotransferase